MLYKKQTIPAGLNFSNFPEVFTTQNPLAVNINATGYGATVKSTGFRWWDINLLTANGVITLAANGSFTLPFSKNFLNSSFLMDLIVKVNLNGNPYWYAASNSPDNITLSTSAEDKKLFHIDLFCMGLTNSIGNSLTNNHFMQGGTGTFGEGSQTIKVYLSEPSTAVGSFSIVATYLSYNNTTPVNAVFTKTVNYSANQSAITLSTIREIFLYFFNTFGYLTYQHAGYYKIQVTCSDPSYTSMLNYYHYGQSD